MFFEFNSSTNLSTFGISGLIVSSSSNILLFIVSFSFLYFNDKTFKEYIILSLVIISNFSSLRSVISFLSFTNLFYTS